jgi:60 kDa SS-A/Ro ribonucleoprotein
VPRLRRPAALARPGPERPPVATAVPPGVSWAADPWTRLQRFLLFGSVVGSAYVPRQALGREHEELVERCLGADGARTVEEIVRARARDRAPRRDAPPFALGLAAARGDEATRHAAAGAIPLVCRSGADLLLLAARLEEEQAWSEPLRAAIRRWYATVPADVLARLAVTERAGERGHRALVGSLFPEVGRAPLAGLEASRQRLLDWIVRGGEAGSLPHLVEGHVRALAARTPEETARAVREFGLPGEAVRPEHLGTAVVWQALLEQMPLGPMLESLGPLTRAGVLAPGSLGTAHVLVELGDAARIRAARVHPFALLAALRRYARGRAASGRPVWEPVPEVVEALEAAFYAAFPNVVPAGVRLSLALDVSRSMTGGWVAGVPGLSPRDAAVALALVARETEPNVEIVGFHVGPGGWRAGRREAWVYGRDGVTPLAAESWRRLGDAARSLSALRFGVTDPALPILRASEEERELDAFVVLTDSAVPPGPVHPVEALWEYRRASGLDARLVVAGLVSDGFAVADPRDPLTLDVVGCDLQTPQLLADFAGGRI